MILIKNSQILRLCALLLGATALSGCLGNDIQGAVTSAAFDEALEEVQGRVPTSDMPLVGTASYRGATKLTGTGQALGGEVFGEINLDVDFGAAADEAITGTASNFIGNLDGVDYDIEGTLSTSDAFPTALAVVESTITLPTGGTQNIATGSVLINMTGDVTANGETRGVLLSLGGAFVGPGGEAIHGVAGLQPLTSVVGVAGPSVGSGTWFVVQD